MPMTQDEFRQAFTKLGEALGTVQQATQAIAELQASYAKTGGATDITALDAALETNLETARKIVTAMESLRHQPRA